MRIDFNSTAAGQIGNENSAQAAGKTAQQKQAHLEDTASLSTDSVSISSLADQAMKAPEIRQEKVDALRQSIADETYKVNAGQVADAILGERR